MGRTWRDDRGELFSVLLEVADDEALGHGFDRQLAADGMYAALQSVSRSQRFQSPGDAIGAGGDPVEELTRGQRAIPLED